MRCRCEACDAVAEQPDLDHGLRLRRHRQLVIGPWAVLGYVRCAEPAGDVPADLGRDGVLFVGPDNMRVWKRLPSGAEDDARLQQIRWTGTERQFAANGYLSSVIQMLAVFSAKLKIILSRAGEVKSFRVRLAVWEW